MGNGSVRRRTGQARRAAARAGGNFIGANTANAIGRLRNRGSGSLSTQVRRARANNARRRVSGRPRPTVR